MVYDYTGEQRSDFFRKIFMAGALPVIDTQYVSHATFRQKILNINESGILFGVRVQASNPDFFQVIKDHFYQFLDLIVISGDWSDDKLLLDDLHSSIFLEVNKIIPHELILSLDPHGLIIKGADSGVNLVRDGQILSSIDLLEFYTSTRLPLFIQGEVTFHTACGFFSAGASGLVLNHHFMFAEDFPGLSEPERTLIKLLNQNAAPFSAPLFTGKTTEHVVNNALAFSKSAPHFNESAEIKGIINGLFQQISKHLSRIDHHPIQIGLLSNAADDERSISIAKADRATALPIKHFCLTDDKEHAIRLLFSDSPGQSEYASDRIPVVPCSFYEWSLQHHIDSNKLYFQISSSEDLEYACKNGLKNWYVYPENHRFFFWEELFARLCHLDQLTELTISLFFHLDHISQETLSMLTGTTIALSEKGMRIGAGQFDNGENLSADILSQTQMFRNLNSLEIHTNPLGRIEDDIAVIGIGCVMPGSTDTNALWENICTGATFIREVSEDRLKKAYYFDTRKDAVNKTNSLLVGEITDYVFDHEKYGYKPKRARTISRSQKLLLDAAYEAAKDSGCLDHDGKIDSRFKEKTCVIVGTSLTNELLSDLHFKYYFPEVKKFLDSIEAFKGLEAHLKKKLLNHLREGMAQGFEYEPVHGPAINIESARIAHHLGIYGPHYTVDSSCASFTALECGMDELLSGTSDLVFAGGVNSNLTPEMFVGLSKMGVLSDKGCFPFDQKKRGFVSGEGAGIVVLKRLKDALRDGNRIRCIIKGIGSASGAIETDYYTPDRDALSLAMKNSFEMAGVGRDQIGFIEACGISLPEADRTELDILRSVYGENSQIPLTCIKSQIGHLSGASGISALIKAILFLEKDVIPSFLGSGAKEVEQSGFQALKVVSDKSSGESDQPSIKYAAINSFGLGGLSYHCIIGKHCDSSKIRERSIFSDLEYDYNNDRIVLTGTGIVIPGATDKESFWKLVCEGNSMLSKIPESRYASDYYHRAGKLYQIPNVPSGIITDFYFNSEKFGIVPDQKMQMNRGHMYAIDVASQVFEELYDKGGLVERQKTGVIFGTIAGENLVRNILSVRVPFIRSLISDTPGIDRDVLENISDALSEIIYSQYGTSNSETIPGFSTAMISGRVADLFKCIGPNFVVDASCASVPMGLSQAIQKIRLKKIDAALTGGVDANTLPTMMIGFKRLHLLSDSECRFFDNRSNGYVIGEGAAATMLTTYGYAVKNGWPVYGELKGLGIGSSAPENILSPSNRMFFKVIDDTFAHASVKKREVLYIDVTGFSNVVLDLIEKQAIETSFHKPIYFNNIKGQVGYFKSANPAVVLSKLVLMMKCRTLPANTNYDAETTMIEKDSVMRPLLSNLQEKIKPDFNLCANVNGIGGNHAHMILGLLPAVLRKKSAIFAKDIQATSEKKQETTIKSALLLTWPMAISQDFFSHLYHRYRPIKSVIDQGDKHFSTIKGYSIRECIIRDLKKLKQHDADVAQFLMMTAIFACYKKKGYQPDYFVGYGVGEFTALSCAGVIGFKDTLALLARRSGLIQDISSQRNYRNISINRDEAFCKALVQKWDSGKLCITGIIHNDLTVVSCPVDHVNRLSQKLTDNSIPFKVRDQAGDLLPPIHFKTGIELAQELDKFDMNVELAPSVVSCVTGKPYPSEKEWIVDEIADHFIRPVNFLNALDWLHRHHVKNVIEVGQNVDGLFDVQGFETVDDETILSPISPN